MLLASTRPTSSNHLLVLIVEGQVGAEQGSLYRGVILPDTVQCHLQGSFYERKTDAIVVRGIGICNKND